MERVILHCDMNNYFATVEEKCNPALTKIPFAVCGDPAMRHSIVMAKNSLAKSAGIITGLSYRQAKEICPSLAYVKANMPRYLDEAKAARKIYRKYSDTIIPYGMDEAWIDLTETGVNMKQGRQIADLIRLEILYARGLSASVGVSDNLIFSKFGSDYKKPNATTIITKANYQQLVWSQPVSRLLFVGQKRKKILETGGICTIGDIARAKPETVVSLLGKTGYDIWCFANGDDRNFHPENDKIGSIGNTITPRADLHSNEDAGAIIYLLATSITTRLKKHQKKAYCIRITIKDSKFNTLSRQNSTSYPTDNRNFIFNQAFTLFRRHYAWEHPLRSVGLRADDLVSSENEQCSLFRADDCDICVNIEKRVKTLTKRLGKIEIEPSMVMD